MHYPPDKAVGAVRPGRVAAALRQRGHDVTVLAVGDPAQADQRCDNASLVRFRPWPHPATLVQRVRAFLAGRSTRPASDGGSLVPRAEANTLPGWKRFLLSILLTPDEHLGIVPPGFRRALTLLDRRVDLVYTSGPPQSVHVLGLLLKIVRRRFWVLEFRDPWIDNPVRTFKPHSRLADRLERWLERACLRRADLIVTTTAAVGDLVRQALPEARREDVIVARNGIDAPPGPPSSAVCDPNIAYFGSLYLGRDPRPFLRAFALLVRERRAPAGARVDFYGDCGRFAGEDLAGYVARQEVTDAVTFHGSVPAQQARELMNICGFLLLFAQRQPLQVPHKLYDYLASGRPIIVITEQDSETAILVRQLGRHHIIDASLDTETLAKELELALAATWPPPDSLYLEHLHELEADVQINRLVSALEQAFSRATGQHSPR